MATMSSAENLIENTEVKYLRNPFGFTFQLQWNKQTKPIPGDGRPVPLARRLWLHGTKHLFMKVINAYYDEQKIKMRAVGKSKEDIGRYRVPAKVEDAVWFAICGEHLHPDMLKAQEDDAEINFEMLKEAEDEASHAISLGGNGMSISELVETATKQAGAVAAAGGEDSSHVVGAQKLIGNEVNVEDTLMGATPTIPASPAPDTAQPAPSMPVTPADAPPAEVPATPAAPAETTPAAAPSNGEFGELQSLG